MAAVDLVTAKKEDEGEWDTFIESSPQGTIFHNWKFLKIMEKHSNSQLFPLMGYKGTELIGVLPLFNKKYFLQNFVYSPPPNTAVLYLGPVLSLGKHKKVYRREKDYIEFINKANSFLNMELKANYTNINLPPNLNDPRPFQWQGYDVAPLFDYSINLNDELDRKLNQKPNNDIGKKENILVEQGNKNDIEIFHSLMKERYNIQNKKLSITSQYLLDLYETFNNDMRIFVIKYNDEIISGVIGFIYKNEFLNFFGLPKYYKSLPPSPNDVLIFEQMKYFYQNNINTLTIIGSAGNARLYKFALKYNPTLKVRFSTRKGSFYINLLRSTYHRFFTK
jgi:hypothetical protein